jgi:hypothetical protein
MSFQTCRDISSRLVIDACAFQLLLMVLNSWVERREREAIAYLIEENRLCGASLGPGAGTP